jgi:hypothetical protein
VGERRVFLGMIVVVVVAICGSCSSAQGPGGPGTGITGQWSGTLTSATGQPSNGFDVDFFQAGSGVFVNSGLMITGLRCDTPTESATGNIEGTNLTFTALLDNASYVFTGTVSADGTAMAGTYKQTTNTGSNCPGGDSGTWSLQVFPNFSGSYSGPIDTSDPINATQATMTVTLSESNFIVSVSASATNSMCFGSGTFSGPAIGSGFQAATSDQTITFTGGEPRTPGRTPPPSVTAEYNFNEPGQPCDGEFGSGLLTRK